MYFLELKNSLHYSLKAADEYFCMYTVLIPLLKMLCFVSVLQFCGTIVLIFILEMAAAVLAFLFQDWVRDRVETFFKTNIKFYRDDIDLQNLIDSLQTMVCTSAV